MAKRVVVWGTGFVGKMVIPEIVRHPSFDVVGVGVSSPEKVGKDVGEICGIAPTGLAVAHGLIYISNYGVFPGTGPGPHGEVVSLAASSVR